MKVIRGGDVVTPRGREKRDVWMSGGKIAAPPSDGRADEEFDADGCLIFPGFIDAHTHLQMEAAGTVTADDFPSGTAAAVSGGTTVILDFATQDRGHSLGEALDTWHARADSRCFCDYGFHMAVTDWNDSTRAELPDMVSAGVTSFKAYMAYDNLRLTDARLSGLLAAAHGLGGIVGVHCELGDEVDARVSELLSRGCTGPRYHPLSRPNSVEAMAIRRLLQLAAECGAPAWVVHLSTREGLQEIESARARGQRVLVETCPQYVTLTDKVYITDDFSGAKFVCSPPIRSELDKEKLWEALADKEVDIISTDHCSFNYEGQKELGIGDFSKIPNGLPGIEHRPALVWTFGVSTGRITAERMCALLSEEPARAFGMWPNKGSLQPGADADVVVWDPGYRGFLRAGSQLMHCDYSPWEGAALTGRAKEVFLRGELAAADGRPVGPPAGEYVPRAPAW